MKIIKEIYPYIIIVIVVVLIRTFIATPVRVDGDSMKTNLLDGQILILYKLSKIERYDIVVLKEDTDDKIIKRVYGMPGDTIRIEHNKIYINDKVIDDKFGVGETSNYSEVKLGKDEYFVLGDNREISKDSRSFGPVKKQNIKGEAIFRVYPFNKMGNI